MNGLVIYDGPSQWDDIPIVVIVTGISRPSSNPKTGPMLQAWILMRDIHPHEAVVSGADESICGHCTHRRDEEGNRTCYVSMNAPGAVWKTYRAGKYRSVSPREAGSMIARRSLRIGAYGDPAMAPIDVWRQLIRRCSGTTGYTHQWREMPVEYREFCMASVETEEEAAEAMSLGYRTFRCISKEETLLDKEILCPASEEAGKLTTCDRCGLCGGSMSERTNRIPTIAITIHGSGAKHFKSETLRKGKEAHYSLPMVEQVTDRQVLSKDW